MGTVTWIQAASIVWFALVPVLTEITERIIMGYRRKPREYHLKFEDDEFDGLIVKCGSLSVDEFIEITTLATRLQATTAESDDVARMFDILADKIIEWNLEDDDGKPVGHTPADLRAQDFDFIMTIQMSWMTAMAKVPNPLLSGSNNGGTTQEAITASLANLSRSLPNSPRSD